MENSQNKVLLDCRFWGPSHTGLGRYTQELVTAMQALKPKLDLVRLTPKITKIKPYSWAEQRYLTGLIRSFKPDLTHFLHFNVPLNFPGPFVVTIHDLIKHHSKGLGTTTHWPGTYWLKRLGYHLVVKKAVLVSQKIFVPSRWVKDDILSHYAVKADKIVITPEAASQEFFKDYSRTKPPLDQPYFIYVGNVYPHKNVACLLEARKLLTAGEPEVKLVIVTGRDWFYQYLQRQLTGSPARSLVKLQDFSTDADLGRFYHHAAAFVTASRFEGFGLPGLEAMAARTLVLSSRRAALPETYGNHAEYFDPDRPEELAEKMKQCLRLPVATRLKKINQAQSFCRQYTWEQTAKKTLAVYESCFSLRPRQ